LSLPITLRAREVLLDVSSSLAPKYVWIDSICINQADLNERAQQVTLMGDIYRGAERVLVWLGKATHATLLVRTIFPQIRLMAKHDAEGRKVKPRRLYGVTIAAITELMNHPYWTRTWIIQEIAMGKSVKFRYGRASMTWDEFSPIVGAFLPQNSNMMAIINRLFRTTEEILPPKALIAIANIFTMRAGVQSKADIHIFFREAAWCVLGSESTDPRDKIYGVLGMVEDGGAELLRPNYTKPVQDIYRDAVRYLIAGEDPFRFLHYAGMRVDSKISVLSWVPDWTLYPEAAFLGPVGHPLPYCAGGSAPTPPHIDAESPTEVHLTGIRVDQLQRVANFVVAYHHHGSMHSEGLNLAQINFRWISEALSLAISSCEDAQVEYGGGQDRFEAFWRTICGDRLRFPVAMHPAPDLGPGLISWYRELKRGLGLDLILAGYNRVGDSIMGNFYITGDAEKIRTVFSGTIGLAGYGRKMAITTDRRMALVPQSARVGDEIWVILGSETPHCLRRTPDEEAEVTRPSNRLQLVGESYLHGIMDGEVLKSEHEVEKVILV
jgi:hypothetical protein